MTKPPFIDLHFAPAEVTTRLDGAGGLVVSSPMELGEPATSVAAMLEFWSATAPDRPFLAERAPDASWRTITYSETRQAVGSLAQALLERGADPDHPVMLLSGNSIDSALVQLAAMEVGVPAAPISPAYSLMSQDFAKVSYISDLLTPSVVFAADGAAFAESLGALDPARVVVGANPRPNDEVLGDWLASSRGEATEAAAASVGPDTIAKVLFTSGSTGMPKGVKNTQGMLCSNQQAIVQLWPFLRDRSPVIVDWLPWSHTFGGNHNFNMILFNGGTLYIDGGKPAPGLFDATVENLREIPATMYFNVPAGYSQLVPRLQNDAGLCEIFFRDLDVLFYAAAALPQNLWEQLEDLSIGARSARVRMLSAWGSTETSPMATAVHFAIERAGVIGLPAPGSEIKLAPVGDKMELRVRGPNVTPGYWRQPDLTSAAFDADGYFKMGDAGRLIDEEDPSRGLAFDGRIAENFKLMSGTWVHACELRVAVVASCAPLIQDAVLTGHDRDEIGLLVFPNIAALRILVPGLADDAPIDTLLRHPDVHQGIASGLKAHNEKNLSGSRRVARALLMAEPPNIDANEITDKGYVNQRAVLDRRAQLVDRMYKGAGDDLILL